MIVIATPTVQQLVGMRDSQALIDTTRAIIGQPHQWVVPPCAHHPGVVLFEMDARVIPYSVN